MYTNHVRSNKSDEDFDIGAHFVEKLKTSNIIANIMYLPCDKVGVPYLLKPLDSKQKAQSSCRMDYKE